jgi:hypothetical protein
MEIKMKKKMILLFSHKLTKLQIEDAQKSLNIKEFMYLPDDLQAIWSNITPYGDTSVVKEELKDILNFVKDTASSDDVVMIQGDFIATCIAVKFVQSIGLKALASTTYREAKEIHNPDGSVSLKHDFKHIQFREYPTN